MAMKLVICGLILTHVLSEALGGPRLQDQCQGCITNGQLFIKGWHFNAIQNFFCSNNKDKNLPGTLIMDSYGSITECANLFKDTDKVVYGSLFADNFSNGTALEDILKLLKKLTGNSNEEMINLVCTSFVFVFMTFMLTLVNIARKCLRLRCSQCRVRLTFRQDLFERSRQSLPGDEAE